MKKILFVMAIVGLITFMSSCEDDTNVQITQANQSQTFIFYAEGGEKTYSFDRSYEVKMEESQFSWIKPEMVNSNGKYTVTIKVDKNEKLTSEQFGTIIIKGDNKDGDKVNMTYITLTVVQLPFAKSE